MIPSFDHDTPHPDECAGGIGVVLAVLGPDKTASEWAAHLGVSVDAVRGLSETLGLALAWEPARVGHRERDVLDSLASLGTTTAPELAEHIGIHQRTAWHKLENLHTKGLAWKAGTIRRKGHDVMLWRLSALGLQVLRGELAEGREPGVREVAHA